MPGRNRIYFVLGFVVVLLLAILLGGNDDTVRSIISSPRWENYRPDFDGDGQVIGIEFGNETYHVGIQRNGTFEIIPDAQGRTEMNSCVLFRDSIILTGYDATTEPFLAPENTVCGIRQVIGREFSEPQLRRDIKHLSYNVKNRNGKPVVQVWRKGEPALFTPEEVLAKSLRKLKLDAERYLDEPVTKAVITVPSHFNDMQRQATKDAGFLAGLSILRLTNEPTAAALAHKLDEKYGHTNDEALIMVYDVQKTAIGVTISVLDSGVYEILAQATTSDLGGRDIDSALLQLIVTKYNDTQHQDITRDAGAMGRLHYEIRKAEAALSVNSSAKIEIQPRKHTSNFSETVTPTAYHDLHEQLFQRTTGVIDQALSQAKVVKKDIHHIIMTGHPARTSKLRPFLSSAFDNKEIVLDEFASNEAFVRGAASTDAILFGDEGDVYSFGIDIAPLSLGVGTADGIVKKIIPGFTVIPTRKSQVFSTVTDDQSTVLLEIFEGARPLLKDNVKLGVLELSGIRRADAGIPRIEVVFTLEPNSVLTVVARELETDNEVKLVVPNRQGKEYGNEVEAMLKDSETNHELDLKVEEAALHSWISRPVNPVGVIPLRSV